MVSECHCTDTCGKVETMEWEGGVAHLTAARKQRKN